MREIGTQKIGSHIMNLHIKRPRITVNLRIGSRKMVISQSHILAQIKRSHMTRAACTILRPNSFEEFRISEGKTENT